MPALDMVRGRFPRPSAQRTRSCRFRCSLSCKQSKSSVSPKLSQGFSRAKSRPRTQDQLPCAADRLLSEVQQRKQEEPQSIHEVPVIGSNFGGHESADTRGFEFAQSHIEQRANSTNQVSRVKRGEHVKK